MSGQENADSKKQSEVVNGGVTLRLVKQNKHAMQH